MAQAFLVCCYSVLLVVVLTQPCSTSYYPRQNWAESSSARGPCNAFRGTWPSFFNLFESPKSQIPFGPTMSVSQRIGPPCPPHAKWDLIMLSVSTSHFFRDIWMWTDHNTYLEPGASGFQTLRPVWTKLGSVFKGIGVQTRGMGKGHCITDHHFSNQVYFLEPACSLTIPWHFTSKRCERTIVLSKRVSVTPWGIRRIDQWPSWGFSLDIPQAMLDLHSLNSPHSVLSFHSFLF